MTVKTVIQDRLAMLRAQADEGDTMAKVLIALQDTDLMTPVRLTAPAAKTATFVAAAIAANAASNAFTIAASPDTPRNVRVVFGSGWDGGNVTVNGTDQFGNVIAETLVAVAGTTVVGTKVFKTVTSASKASVGATTNTASIGIGDKLGLPFHATTVIGTAGIAGAGMFPAVVDLATMGIDTTGIAVPDGTHDVTLVATS